MLNEILKYFPDLSSRQIAQLEMLGTLYPEWNDKINVISRKDIDNLYVNHVLHSLAIGKFLNPVNGTSFIDIGTGGGFPGIPMAIVYPECRYHLIDRIRKKINVVNAVAEALELNNVTVQAGDLGECREKFNYAVCRGVMPMAQLFKIARKNISLDYLPNLYPNGILSLKGGDLTEELKALNVPYFNENLSVWFKEDFFRTKSLIYIPIK